MSPVTGRRGSVRIGAGTLRGRSLPVPKGVRPTGSRVREALFDILGPSVRGMRLLDLYAGSGAVGIEAVSRGAAAVVLVESERSIARGLRRQVREWGLSEVTVREARLPAALERLQDSAFDLVFADPPYAFDGWSRLLTLAAPLLAPGGALVAEHDRRGDLPEAAGDLRLDRLRSYGETELGFYGVASEPAR